MSDQLHRFLPALLLVAAFSAHAADLPASELLKVADDALQAGTITQLEHRQTVAWIKARPCSGIDHRSARPERLVWKRPSRARRAARPLPCTRP
ncbi:hypothetical protein LP419_30815 [Massilia sp. H-1]|nr:hypothetical protein LP419_30815 [Massilia sp. H-1]